MPQPVFVDAELELDLTAACQSDTLADTVDYVDIQRTLNRVTIEREYVLVERLAERLAQAVLAEFPVRRILLTVSKPEALRQFGVANTAIRIERRRP